MITHQSARCRIPINFICRVAMLIFICIATSSARAQDTASVEGLNFTPIEQEQTESPVAATAATVGKAEKPAAAVETHQTLWAIFLTGMAGGFAALFMPCIFPMLPLTISYFTKKNQSKARAIRSAMFYGISIIVIYVVLGLLITIAFGPDALNSLATNGVFNFLFFILLVIFAASFFGAFEITLPSRWVNKMDERSDKGGLAGLFFMAATLSLVSFSCTGPIIGTLLVQAAVTGALLGPAIGMFGFSFALALPFTLFAMFPSLLKSMPKSGGWLNSVKVVLGFLELALALKFLSNVDLAYHWQWFDREIFLVLWIVIFALMGFYLLGKLTFSHDSQVPFISVPRLFMAIITFAFTVYMIPGLWGAPLKSISAFLPPMATQDFDLSNVTSTSAVNVNDAQPKKYVDLFDKPKGFNPFFDYDEALAYAKKVGKPMMIDFTGHACVNCRKMEADVWPDKDVNQRINQDYVLVQLYVDDKTDLASGEQFTTPGGKSIKTIGSKWSYLQTSKFGANSQPFYVLLDPETEQPIVAPEGANYVVSEYLKYLDSGLSAFKK